MFKLAILFTTTHSNTLGNACRLDLIKFLSEKFDSIIVTNQIQFLKRIFPDLTMLEANGGQRSFLPLIDNIRFWKKTANILNKTCCDAVFIFDDDSPCTLWIKHPVFQYVHQYGRRSNETGNGLKQFLTNVWLNIIENLKIKGLRKSQFNFIVSKSILEYFQSKGVFNSEVIPHALKINSFICPILSKEHDLIKNLKEKGFFIVTYTGWISENRGFELMLNSIMSAHLVNNKIVLIIAGTDIEFSERIEIFKKRNQLEDVIYNYGIIDASYIPGILHFSDVCLSFLTDVPAFRVSPPQKIIEYFASGKPVICNKIAPHEWLVTHGENGLIINYDFEEVSNAILELSQNPELLRMMSNNALKEASKYEINDVYGRMTHKINNFLNGHKI